MPCCEDQAPDELAPEAHHHGGLSRRIMKHSWVLASFTIFTANSEVNMMAGVLAPCAGCSRRKRLCVQESLNFINRSKCKEEYGCKDDSVTAG